MKRVAAGRDAITREQGADRLANAINAEVEALILGTQPIEGT